MFDKGKKVLDAFSFSLGGMTTVSSVAAAPAVDGTRINKIRDAHLRMLETRRSEASTAASQFRQGQADLGMQWG